MLSWAWRGSNENHKCIGQNKGRKRERECTVPAGTRMVISLSSLSSFQVYYGTTRYYTMHTNIQCYGIQVYITHIHTDMYKYICFHIPT